MIHSLWLKRTVFLSCFPFFPSYPIAFCFKNSQFQGFVDQRRGTRPACIVECCLVQRGEDAPERFQFLAGRSCFLFLVTGLKV